MAPLLEIQGVTKRFGGVVANESIDLRVEEREIVGVIGPNGAGKSTLFDVITGYYQPDSGSVRFRGKTIVGLRPDQINKLGVARTFQKLRPFGDMTVLENVMVGAFCRTSSVPEAEREALRHIEFVGLSHKSDSLADELSTGQRKRLEMARAMATGAKLLLLDEVTGGVDPQGVPQLVSLMHRLRDEGLALLVIEHRIKVVTGISDRMIALHLGRKIAEGSPADVCCHKQVVESYLGAVYAKR